LLGESGTGAAEKILWELKLDRDTIDGAKMLTESFHEAFPAESKEGDAAAEEERLYRIRLKMSRMPAELFDKLILLKRTLLPEEREVMEEVRNAAEEIRQRGECISLKTLAVNGGDLIRAGVKPGPEMGRILGEMLDHVLRYPKENEKQRLMTYFGVNGEIDHE
ncbi:MAG: hypothetical protein J6O43_05870, partial [Clostridium sp.]|nr:hypothetical protein [Clostridium sp.]